jgi:hypothetical protein
MISFLIMVVRQRVPERGAYAGESKGARRVNRAPGRP